MEGGGGVKIQEEDKEKTAKHRGREDGDNRVQGRIQSCARKEGRKTKRLREEEEMKGIRQQQKLTSHTNRQLYFSFTWSRPQVRLVPQYKI